MSHTTLSPPSGEALTSRIQVTENIFSTEEDRELKVAWLKTEGSVEDPDPFLSPNLLYIRNKNQNISNNFVYCLYMFQLDNNLDDTEKI